MIPYPLSHPALVLGPLAGLVLAFVGGCAYSSSETPRPLEPDYERAAQEQEAEPATESAETEKAGDATPDLLEDDPPAPTTDPAGSWGK